MIGKNLLNEMMKYKDEESKENPIDQKYDALNCKISVVKKDSEERKMVETYLDNTKETRRLKLINLFKV